MLIAMSGACALSLVACSATPTKEETPKTTQEAKSEKRKKRIQLKQ